MSQTTPTTMQTTLTAAVTTTPPAKPAQRQRFRSAGEMAADDPQGWRQHEDSLMGWSFRRGGK